MKTCSRCGEEKADDEYYPNYGGNRCILCVREVKRESNAKIKAQDPDAWRARQRVYQNRYNQRFPEVRRAVEHRRRMRRFGLTTEEYDLMMEDQNAKCAICGLPSEGKALAVDHDHETGEVRGLLCGPCNMALGQLEPSNRLDAAVQYLRRYMK